LPEHFEVFRASGKGDLGNTRFSQGLWISVPNRPISLSDGKINAKTNQPSNPLKRRLRGHFSNKKTSDRDGTHGEKTALFSLYQLHIW
jgi:hypothetical protein